jgi:hypothetical protein
MNTPIKKLKAITDFSKDFTQFQVDNLSVISGVTGSLGSALADGLMDGYFMERVNELYEDLFIIASQDASREMQLQIKTTCHEWVNQHLRNASNMTLVALTLWLDGVEDGREALFDEADISDSANVS